MTEQEKRERVIKGLEHELQNRGKCGHYCRDGRETVSCEYDKDGLCIQHWGNDALALLKAQEQEPIVPIRRSAHAQGADDVWYECGKCGEFLGVNLCSKQFCANCGQAVKWE